MSSCYHENMVLMIFSCLKFASESNTDGNDRPLLPFRQSRPGFKDQD